MKIRLLAIGLALLAFSPSVRAGPRDAEWKDVSKAIKQGLPKTAIKTLESIIAAALKENSYPEAVKAICQKIGLESDIPDAKPEEKVVRLQSELEKAPSAMKPAMEAVLAKWYWEYFQQNRWRFLQRTQVSAASGPDIQTWDLARILVEIDRHFVAALSDETVLKATPIFVYDQLITSGTAPDRYRPTMYDFLAYQALQFYQAGEQASAGAEDDFEISADGPILGDASEFVNWQPNTIDAASPKLKAIKLYQTLLKFHESDADHSASYDADLARLTFGYNVAIGENRNERYDAALRRFIEANKEHEISSRALALEAMRFRAKGEPAKAREIAQRGYHAFPQSEGGAMCFNLINEIERKWSRVDTEQVWTAPWPTLNVTYSNLTKLYFRAVPSDFANLVEQGRGTREGVNEAMLAELVASKPASTWEANLPVANDYKVHTEKLAVPTSLKSGFYFIIASGDPTFTEKDTQVSVATVWISNLALVLRTQYNQSLQSGLVLRANSGDPVAGATVRFWGIGRNGSLSPIAPTKTDENGQFHFSATNEGVVVLAEQGGEAISSANAIYCYNNPAEKTPDTQTVFFTDRAIYRPGQTINYKAISIRYDQTSGKYCASAGLNLTVVFNDANGNEIARATHTSNDYGSINGVFTAPRDRLPGQMTMKVLEGIGATSFRVEEYKRPKFQVELGSPTEAPKLDSFVTLIGKAAAYSGASIGGAKVTWRVERDTQMPDWCWWWRPAAAKAVAHGVTATDADGTFKIRFLAEADHALTDKNEPTFVFRLHADITDTTGETRSCDRTVLAGYTAVRASLSSDEWQTSDKPVEIAIAIKSLDGDPQAASGTVKIHALVQPTTVERGPLQLPSYGWERLESDPKVEPSNPDSWELGQCVVEKTFNTGAAGKVNIAVSLKSGIYRASLETKDRFGKPVTARETIEVVSPHDRHYGVKIPSRFLSPKWTLEPGEKFTVLWGTGYETGRAFVEVECDGKALKSYWTAPDRTQELVHQEVSEEMRGGFTVRVTQVRENRAYINERVVEVPWSNKQLSIKWETFRSKLEPNQKETWTAVVTGPDAKRASAEMVATLYDASLDQFLPQDWPQTFNVFRRETLGNNSMFQNANRGFQDVYAWSKPAERSADWRYRSFAPEVLASVGEEEVIELSPFVVESSEDGGYKAMSTLAGTRIRTELRDVGSAISVTTQKFLADTGASGSGSLLVYSPNTEVGGARGAYADAHAAKTDLGKITSRKNLTETAFFFPQLVAREDGVVQIVFTMPEALTEWKFLGFAHDKQLRSGRLTDTAITTKSLMVEPNPPRFLREGDEIEFTVKISNQSDASEAGTVKLNFADAASQKSVDDSLENRITEKSFEVPSKQSRTYSWLISVPEGMDYLTYKAVAATNKYSDGEEGFLPVLSRRVLVTESLPLPIRGKAMKQFEFKKLVDSGASKTLRQQSLTVQMVSHPEWYAVLALPYLIEYPYECSEQVFNRLYANVLAGHISNSDPRIRTLFNGWKNTPALDSPLEKNQDLKSVMIEETPWLREAKTESQARRNVGLLFDANRLQEETSRAFHTLSDRQGSDGLWSWFPGGPASEYISLYITTGFGRLRHLGIDVDLQPAVKSLAALDAMMDQHYRRILKNEKPEEYVPNSTDALYLYGRSFFLAEQPISAQHQNAVDFFVNQSRKFWLEVSSRQSQAQLALALQRFGDKATPQAIMKSIKERGVSDEELGLFWRDPGPSWWWFNAPIETQAMMIEAFAEVTQDTQAVEDCKVWLLKQKQSQNWRTTKSTADAIYGLLLQGENLLKSNAPVEVSLAGERVEPEKTEAGTGFYERKFIRTEIKPAMGHVTVQKSDDGVSWGSVSWQYLEDTAKVTSDSGTPLKLKKAIFIKEGTTKGQMLKPITGPISVGDELVVRLELRTDRDMEFVHLKDQRGSGTEPVNILSQYKYQDGLAYYETTRDTATHFFIDYLPKGVYVFEYSIRVQLKGEYQSGLAEIQSMYAPEFTSHSESTRLVVQ